MISLITVSKFGQGEHTRERVPLTWRDSPIHDFFFIDLNRVNLYSRWWTAIFSVLIRLALPIEPIIPPHSLIPKVVDKLWITSEATSLSAAVWCREADADVCHRFWAVAGPPGAPEGLSVSDITDTAVQLSWGSGPDNHSPVTMYMVQARTPISIGWQTVRTGNSCFVVFNAWKSNTEHLHWNMWVCGHRGQYGSHC